VPFEGCALQVKKLRNFLGQFHKFLRVVFPGRLFTEFLPFFHLYCVGPPPAILAGPTTAILHSIVDRDRLQSVSWLPYGIVGICETRDATPPRHENLNLRGYFRQPKCTIELSSRGITLAGELLKARARQNAQVPASHSNNTLILELLGRQRDARPVSTEQG